MSTKLIALSFELVPTIKSLQSGLGGIFWISVINVCKMWLLKSGPAGTNYINLSRLSITINDDFDL